MGIETPDRTRIPRPFSRMMAEWSQACRGLEPSPPAANEVCSALQAQMRVDVQRARRTARLAWLCALGIAVSACLGAWRWQGRIARLQEERASLSALLSSSQIRVEQLTETADRRQLDLKTLRHGAATTSQALEATRAENGRLRQEIREFRRELSEARQREAQARARWAYTEGERDALYGQLSSLIKRIESALQAAEQQAKLAPIEPLLDALEPELAAPESYSVPIETEPADDNG
ncbi:MAG: hypothetical protein JSV19_10540 [Phycisphaerales bacterium]|nr:MAG: hypothetical protein JSV19_10540 [Phycisphaerales bacterium]